MTQIQLPTIADGEDKTSVLKNRIRKNYRHIRKWAKRTETNCFRIYDREIREYPFAIDYYDDRFCVHYFTKTREEEDLSPERRREVVDAILSIFNANPKEIYWRTRVKREKTEQYEKLRESKSFFTVIEYGVKFKVNLLDYLDTGLFLDHRETRRWIASRAKDKHVLNLFAYTCSFSVHAALAGAISTTSVDMSNTYTKWGRDNFLLNQLPLAKNPIIRADYRRFLEEANAAKKTFDIIIIDPPTISRSKKMEEIFDIQIDYIPLIQATLPLLTKGGMILFSTNSRSFKFDQELFTNCTIRDITAKTLPIDFHNQKVHRCWEICLNLEGQRICPSSNRLKSLVR